MLNKHRVELPRHRSMDEVKIMGKKEVMWEDTISWYIEENCLENTEKVKSARLQRRGRAKLRER